MISPAPNRPWLVVLIALLGFVFGMFIIHAFHIPYTSEELVTGTFLQKLLVSRPNEIGDTLAGIFGTLAFLAAALAVVMQSFELRAQRQVLEATQDELAQSRLAYEKTNSHLEQQRFESLFFELLNTHNSIVNSIDLRNSDTGNVVSSGRDCFKSFSKDLEKTTEEKFYTDTRLDKTDERYLDLYGKHHSDLGHYFRFIYNAMRVILENKFSEQSHRRLFRALFSDDELLLIFYNARSPHGRKMIGFIEVFEIFNNLPKDRLIYEEHRTFFSDKCFGEAT